MTDESVFPDPVGGWNPTPHQKLDKAAKLRAAAAQAIAAAEKIEADKARVTKDKTLRDQRILGATVIQLAAKSPDLARVLVEGVGTCAISSHDRKHLAREGSALAQLKQIVEKQIPTPAPPETRASVPTLAWFDVPYSDKDRLPAGVLYDPEVKARCAISRAVVEQMRALGFVERQDIANRPPPVRKPQAPPA